MMQFLSRGLSIFVVAVLLITIGCEKQEAASSPPGPSTAAAENARPIKIGFLVKQPTVNWFVNEWRFADEAGKKDGFQVIKLGAPDGPQTLAAIDNLAAQGAQGFVICAPDVKLGESIVERAKRYNMKVMSVDDQLVGADGKPLQDVPHMGISARDIGHAVGQALADEMKKRGWKAEETGACIITHDEFETHRERTEGAIESLVKSGFPSDRIFRSPQSDTAIRGGTDATNAALTRHPDVKNWLIAGINDDSVVGGVRAAENRQFSADHIIAVGIGGDVGLPEFQTDQPTGFVASVLISSKRHGYDTAELMYKWIKDGIAPPPTTWTSGILINRGNYKQVTKEQGL